MHCLSRCWAWILSLIKESNDGQITVANKRERIDDLLQKLGRVYRGLYYTVTWGLS